MADDVKIGSASIDIRVDGSNIKSDFEKAKTSSKKAVDEMTAQLSKIKMGVDSSVLKMKFDEAVKWRNDLQIKFEKQIKMNADVSTIQKTKAALDAVSSSLSNMGGGKIGLSVDTSKIKVELNDVLKLKDELKVKLEQQIKLNLDESDIKQTKTAIDLIESSIKKAGQIDGKMKIDLDVAALKPKYDEALRLRNELENKLEQQINLDADASKIKSQLAIVENQLSQLGKTSNKAKIDVDISSLKTKIDEAEKLESALKAKLEKQIKVNADASAIESTKKTLNDVSEKLSSMKQTKVKLELDSADIKKKFTEATNQKAELKSKLEQQLKLNVDVTKTKDQLREVNASIATLDRMKTNVKVDADTSLTKMKFQEVIKLRDELKAKLEQQIKMNFDVSAIQETKAKLDEVNSALAGTKQAQDDVVDKASKWGMIATGINQTVQALREFFQQAKQLVGQSVNAAAELQVLRDNFIGTAEDLELFKKATAGTVSEAGLIKLSNQASDLGLSLEQQAIFFSMSEDAADKYGGSVEENFGKVIAASEGSVKGVRGLGIETKAFQQKVDELAKAEGDSIQNLDAETQKRIRLTALQQLGGVTLDQVRNKQQDEKDLIEATGIAFDEAKIKLGKFIGEALVPLLKAFNTSNQGIKDTITFLGGLTGVIFNLAPFIIQLYSAKKLFAGATLLSAGSIDVETKAINDNTIARGLNSKVPLGLIGKIGVIAAVGYAVYELTSYINENTKAIKENRSEADRMFANWDKSGFGARNQFEKNKPQSDPGTVNLGGYFQNEKEKEERASVGNKKVGQSIADVRAKIKELTTANEAANITWDKYFKNIAEIEALQKRLAPPKLNEFKDPLEDLKKLKEELAQVNSELEKLKPVEKQRIQATSEKSKLEEFVKTTTNEKNVENVKNVVNEKTSDVKNVVNEENIKSSTTEKVTTKEKIIDITVGDAKAEIEDLNKGFNQTKEAQQDINELVRANILKKRQAEIESQILELEGIKRKEEVSIDYYETLKIYGADWLKIKEAQLDREVEAMKRAGSEELDYERYKTEKKKEIALEYMRDIAAQYARTTNKNGELEGSKASMPWSYSTTKKMKEVPVPEKPNLDFGGEGKILDDYVAGSEVSKAAFDGFINGAMNGLDSLRIKVDENATFMSHAFAGFANAAVQAIEQIIAKWAVFNLISFAIGGPGISLFKMLGLKDGGYVMNGAQVPSFASGVGSYMVPSGFPNDSFPVMVQSGEDLRVRTPQMRASAEMDNRAMLGELNAIKRAIHATNRNLGMSGNQQIVINSKIDGVKFYTDTIQPNKYKIDKGNVKYGG